MTFSETNPTLFLRRVRSNHVVWGNPHLARRTWNDRLGVLDENDLVVVLEGSHQTPIGMVRVLTKFGVGFIHKHNFFDP